MVVFHQGGVSSICNTKEEKVTGKKKIQYTVYVHMHIKGENRLSVISKCICVHRITLGGVGFPGLKLCPNLALPYSMCIVYVCTKFMNVYFIPEKHNQREFKTQRNKPSSTLDDCNCTFKLRMFSI